MDPFILDSFVEDDLNLNEVENFVSQLIEPINIVPNRNIPRHVEGYVANIISDYSFQEFKMHFRLSRSQFGKLCEILSPILYSSNATITLETKLIFFLSFLAKQECFLSVTDKFGFSKGTGHYIFFKVVDALKQLKSNFIKWPNTTEINRIKEKIENKCHFPGVVGFIDGSHINIKQPINNAIDYYNRKGNHSIILQAVCDDRAVFTYIFIGIPGKVHDARVFRNSPLYKKLTEEPKLLKSEEHLLGDAAYPLMKNLLKPYQDNGHLTGRQIKYNQVLASQRQTIERAFGILKGMWRKLKYIDMALTDKIPDVILAACVMHNFYFTTKENENIEDFEVELDIDDEVNENLESVVTQVAIDKRNFIMGLL